MRKSLLRNKNSHVIHAMKQNYIIIHSKQNDVKTLSDTSVTFLAKKYKNKFWLNPKALAFLPH